VLDTLADPISAGDLKVEYSPRSGWGRNLNDVLRCAADLAIIMSKQRSRLELYVPDITVLQNTRNVHVLGKIFDIEEDIECSSRVDIGFVVIPGLRRWGDGLGTNLNHHVDLEAARVKCLE
jgi:hypothetical protein